ncbi:hypothetical protein ACFVT8_13690 [Lysinibacillus sp. NPDC058147]|uniref:hypothetical protein n=1 Tax=Lysinibacillus sp. NPDC058147 TaxID=3346357 RepID=UPI0036DB8701
MIHVKSGDTYFVQQIVGTLFKGNVHSVFKHALNILNLENGEIFTLTTKDMDNAPIISSHQVACYQKSRRV